jgi:methionyl-tRNA formyltransferase
VALRIVFCGTPAFAVPALRDMIAQPDLRLAGVVTQPDRPRGRGQETSSSPVKVAAIEAGIEVFQPETIKSDAASMYFQEVAPDAVVIIAYGQIIPQRLIDIPRLGWINVHASLLPKYRGAAPVNWAIVNGDARSGVTTMRIDAGLDTGPILLKREMEITGEETAAQLTARLAEAGASLIVDTLRGIDRDEITPVPQDHSLATYARPLKKEDGRIDWSLDAWQIHRRIRGLQPWPGAFTSFLGRRCGVWGAPVSQESIVAHLKSAADSPVHGALVTLARQVFVRCGMATWLRLEFVQLEGRRRVTAEEFSLGARLVSGERFGS